MELLGLHIFFSQRQNNESGTLSLQPHIFLFLTVFFFFFKPSAWASCLEILFFNWCEVGLGSAVFLFFVFFSLHIFLIIIFLINLFIFGCVGSSFLCEGFL